jgi:hypothetical protein
MNQEQHTQHTAQSHPPRPPQQQGPSYSDSRSVRAALCALVPGIGAVYNREYTKAVVHFAVFAGLAIIAESVGIFGLAAFSFYVFTIIDAYRSAEVISRKGTTPESGSESLNFPLWGGILIMMGIIFLLDNLGAIRIRSVIEFWPLILVFLGLYLIYSYLHPTGNRESARSSSRAPTEPDAQI